MTERMRAVEQALGLEVVQVEPVAGGDISAAFRVCLSDGTLCFAKTLTGAPVDFFAAEADGLNALAAVDALRVPRVRAVGVEWIALEWIELGAPDAAAWALAGRQLATLHQRTARPQFGWHRDGYIGRTPQPNPALPDAATFWRDARLGPQLARVRAAGHATPELEGLAEQVLTRLPERMPPGEPACLLHGDLWRGNIACSEGGIPVVFDPAAYYGPREAELALCHLFGGFPQAFFDAYAEVWPLPPDAAARRPLFALYHLLNHLNLFGRTYYAQVMAALRQLV